MFHHRRLHGSIAQLAQHGRMLSGRLLLLRSSSRGFCRTHCSQQSRMNSSSLIVMSTIPLVSHGATNPSLCQRPCATGAGSPSGENRVSSAFGKIDQFGILSRGYYLHTKNRRALSVSCDAARKASCEEAFKLAKENGYQ